MTKQQKIDIEIQALLQNIRDESSDKEYIYRGENENFKKISSTLYRQYQEIKGKYFDLEIVQNEMLKQAKQYTTLKDDEILTEMQHYGGATNYIDFTSDYLTALFFACDGELKKGGRIILFKDEDGNKDNTVIKPAIQNNRILLQKSIFVSSKKGYLKETEVTIITIESNLKTHILEYLKKYHGISTSTIYKDILGYIQIQKTHKSAYTEFYKGFTEYDKGNYQEALKHYNKAIELNSNFVEAHNNRGNVKANLRRYKQAILDYSQAIALNLDYAEAYNNRGTAKANLKQYPEAIADYNKTIELNPDYTDAYYNRGATKADLKQYLEAIADYDQAIALNPDYAKAYNNRGTVKANLKQYPEAIADYNKTIELNPDYSRTYYNRGNVKANLKQYDKAIADYDEVIALDPYDTQAYYNRGNAKAKLGQNNEAIRDFTKAKELSQQQNNQAMIERAQKMIDILNGKVKNN